MERCVSGAYAERKRLGTQPKVSFLGQVLPRLWEHQTRGAGMNVRHGGWEGVL